MIWWLCQIYCNSVMYPGSFQQSWGSCCTLLPTGSLSKYPTANTQYPRQSHIAINLNLGWGEGVSLVWPIHILVHHSTCVTGSRGTTTYRHLFILSGHWTTLQSIATRTFKKLDKSADRLCCRNVTRSTPQRQGRVGEWRGNILTTETCICTQVDKAQHCW